MRRGNNIPIRYSVDFSDKGTRELLREDRRVRTAVQQTSATMAQSARRASTAAAQSANAARRQTSAHHQTGQSARGAARSVDAASRASRQATSAHGREAVSARRVAQSYDQVTRSAARAAAAQKRAAADQRRAIGGAIGAGAGAVRAPAMAGAAAAGIGLAALTASGISFEKQMDRVGAVAGATSRQLARMDKQAMQLGADTQFSAKEAADGMYQLSTAGFTANETMKIIPGTLDLAAASGVELAQAAELQAAAIRGFGLSAKDAGRVADVLAKTVNSSAVEMTDLADTLPYVASTARQTGTSFEQVAAAAGILGNAGIKGSMAGTALRTSMLRLTDPTEKMQGVFARMGLDASKLAAVPLPEVIGRVAEGLRKLPTQGERVGAISAIFGKEAAPAMLNLMSKGREEIDKLVKGLENSRGTAKATAKDMRDNVAGAWDEFTGSVETAGIALEKKFQKPLKEALKGGAGFVNELTAGLTGQTRTREVTRTMTGRGGRPIQVTRTEELPGTGPQRAGTGIRGVITDVATAAGPVLAKAGKALAQFGKDMIGALKPAMPILKNVFIPLWKGAGQAILAVLATIMKVLPPVVKLFATGWGAVGRVLRPLRPLFQLIGNVIASIFGPAILRGLSAVVAGFGRFGRIVSPLLRGVGAAIELFYRATSTVFRGLVGVIRPVVTFLAGRFAVAFRAASSAVRSATGLIGRVVSSMVQLVGRVIGRIVRIVAAPFRDAFGAARAAVSAAGRSIGGAVRSVVNTVGRVFSGIGRRVISPVRGAFNSVVTFLGNVAGKIGEKAGSIVSRITGAFTGIAGKILSSIGRGGAALGGFVKSLANGVIKLVENAINSVDKIGPISVPDVHLPRFQRGGQAEGLALVSPGEMAMFPSGQTAVVPGSRTAADNVLASFPRDTMIFTSHGQQLLAGGATTGQALAHQLPHFARGGVTGASAYGLGEAGTGVRGYRGDYLPGKMAFAELGMGRALGGLPHRAKLEITYKGRSVVASKLDIGRGGGPVRGRTRAIDLWRDTARALRFPGLDLVRYSSGAGKREGVTRGRGGSTRISLPSKLSFGAGLQGPVGAFHSGFEAGLEGTPLWESANVGDIVSAARARLERRSKTISNVAAGGGAVGGPESVQKMIRFGLAASRKNTAYRYAGGHPVGGGPPYDCSGYVGNILLAGGLLRGGNWTTDNLKTFGRPGGGKHVTIGVRGSTGRNAHTMMRVGRYFFESGSGHGAKAVSGWSGSFPIKRHPRGLRRGGIIGVGLSRMIGAALPTEAIRALTDPASPAFVGWGLRRGGIIPAFQAGGVMAESAARRRAGARERIRELADLPTRSNRVRSVIKGLAGVLDNAEQVSYAALDRLRKSIERQIKALRRHGVTQQERVQIRRLGAADRLIATEMGRRTGLIVRSVEQQKEAMERARTRLSQLFRRRGVDEASAAGVAALRDFTRTQIGQLKGMEASLVRALRRARRVRDRQAVVDITERLKGIRDDLAETSTTWIEQVREAIRASAQQQVDIATHGSSIAGIGLQRLELSQRLAGSFETGGAARAQYIRSVVLPALQREANSLRGQWNAAAQAGDAAGTRQAREAFEQKTLEMMQAQLDAQEQTAENTEPLKEFNGTTAFELFGERWTDRIFGALVGV